MLCPLMTQSVGSPPSIDALRKLYSITSVGPDCRRMTLPANRAVMATQIIERVVMTAAQHDEQYVSMSNSPGSERMACQEGMCSESPEPLAGRLGAPAQRRHRV
jgi:hypothetical protein